MMNALYSAATGMSAQQVGMDVIANNLANVNTAGYKATRLTFEDLLYTQVGSRQASLEGAQVGMGVAPARTELMFTQGTLTETGSPTNMAIEGNGFFRVQVGDQYRYTRDGNFSVDANGQLVTSNGYRLDPEIVIPQDTDLASISLTPTGRMTAKVGGVSTVLGQVEIVGFSNPAGLLPIGDNLFAPTINSGDPTMGIPGTGDRGFVRGGFIEASNVSTMEEMINMITSQRAFESVAKVISTSDEMLGIANSIRR